MKDFFRFREELEEARRTVTKSRKVGAPLWAKGTATVLATKVYSKGKEVKAQDDPKIRDGKLADQISLSAALTTLGIAVSSNDKTLISKAKRGVK